MTAEGAALTANLDSRIHTIRHGLVLLDRDLAAVYAVPTRPLNQARRRNPGRFPPDFAFQLTIAEAIEVRTNVKYLPWAYTEHGAIMAASVLSSPRAVEMSVFVVRAFVRLRTASRDHTEIAKKLAALERQVTRHDESLKQVFVALRQMLTPSTVRPRIGF